MTEVEKLKAKLKRQQEKHLDAMRKQDEEAQEIYEELRKDFEDVKDDVNYFRTKAEDYEHALINIAKLAGVSWDGDRVCHDQGHVAHLILNRWQSELWEQVRDLPYNAVEVDRESGQVSVDKRALAAYKKLRKKA
jgi:dGTP triphosphohydrolase